MATIPWLADVLRAAGLVVIEHPGWRTRMRPGTWQPQCGIVHATAAPVSQSDDVQVQIVRDGRSDLIGPIANACVDRRGRWHVLSAGRCNTTLEGTAGPFRGVGNAGALGVEACNNNINEPWPATQYESYARGWAAICRRLGWRADRLVGHKEHTPGRKTDPTFGMGFFRDRVQQYIDNPAAADEQEEPEMDVAHAALLRAVADDWAPNQQEYLQAGGSEATWKAMADAGMVGANGRINKLGQNNAAVRGTLAAMQITLKTLADAIVGAGSPDAAAIIAEMQRQGAALTDEIRAAGAEARDAVADLGEGGASQVRTDADTPNA